MNKLARTAVVGSAAMAIGLMPGISAFGAIAPTPIPAPTAPVTPAPTTSTPVAHVSHAHASPTRSHHKHGPHHIPVIHHVGVHRIPTHKSASHKSIVGNGSKGHSAESKPTGGNIKSGKSAGGQSGNGKSDGSHAGNGKPGGVQPEKNARARPVPEILGGSKATNAPWGAQVLWDSVGFQCSGTVIAPQWVLTAGHCATNEGMSVQVGSLELGKGTKVTVDAAKIDPSGDIALLHLAQPVRTEVVALADQDPEVGSINEIYGWGKTSMRSGPSPQLKTAQVKVNSLDCLDAQGGKAICSTGVNGSAFHGDSGGPEMANGVEVGVCSTGDDQQKTQQYASIAANRNWIQQVAGV